MSPDTKVLDRRLAALANLSPAARLSEALSGSLMGLEKEALRVSPAGRISRLPHPAGLGSPLTHPYITTDFSEALIELVTPALGEAQAVLDFLADLHTEVYRHLGEEILWGTSMPCILEGARNIPLARYGSSNAATMKTVYRRGLGNRYGRTMQAIAGVHFNYSFGDAFWDLYRELEGEGRASADGDRAVAGGSGEAAAAMAFRCDAYMGMIRNLQRVGWLVPYLFGASPAVCASFVAGQDTDLVPFDANTLHYPFATSLRMGDIGYQNQQEQGTGIKASYDSLDAYIRGLTWAIETPCPQYETIGVRVGDRWEQLSANVLQIENEYYSTVRPKQILSWLEKPTLALRRRGIRYVELRSVDVSCFEPLGVGAAELHFLETMMLDCLLAESPRIGGIERRAIDENQVLAAHRGREPGLLLNRLGEPVALSRWAAEILDRMGPAAELLDGGAGGPRAASLALQLEKVRDPDVTPSARILAEMRARGEGFFHHAYRLSGETAAGFRGRDPAPERCAELALLAARSLDEQAALEAADEVDFATFLEGYFAQGSALD